MSSRWVAPLKAIYTTLFPSTCACCGQVLVAGERQVCLDCMVDLSPQAFGRNMDNPAERQLLGMDNLGAAMAMCRFVKGGTVQHAVHAMKFHSNTELCLLMGRQLGSEVVASGRFDDVDLLVPVPLHWLRRLGRGYNQSMLLCRGMAEVFGRPIEEGNLVRHRYTHKQSTSRASQRDANVMGAFRVRHPERLADKHILLVDDVLTTGATLRACADALAVVPGIKVSVAVFSMV